MNVRSEAGEGVGATPNTSASFRNVRPLQTAFVSNGLVSKKRRSDGATDENGVRARSAHEDSNSFEAAGVRDAFQHARPLREVVEAAMADRSFNVSRSSLTMPDTPMKPMASDLSSSVRMHRRGRSMGGAFPLRPSSLFSSTPKPTSAAAPLAARHTRSVSERVSVPAGLFDVPTRPAAGDPDDVFDAPASSPQGTDIPQRRSRARRMLGEADARPTFTFPRRSAPPPPPRIERPPSPSPFDEPMSDDAPASPVRAACASAMDSPNNCFVSSAPVCSTPAVRLPRVDVSFGTPHYAGAPLPSPPTSGRATPLTPTRTGFKWFEAVEPHSPSTVRVRALSGRPRHSQPAYALQTPPAPQPRPLVQSAPQARYQSARSSQFDDHFVVESVLGAGEFSEVVKVREKATGYVSAVKRMKRPFVGPKDRVRRLEEVDVMSLLKQRRATWSDPLFGAAAVVDLLDAWEEDGYLFLQTELCPLGSFSFVLAEYGRQVGALDEARLWKVLAELAGGVDFIHQSGVLHLDLKPANVLITEIGTLKITDFGMATRWPRCSAQEVLAGAHVETHKFVQHDADTSGESSSSGSSAAPPEHPRRRGLGAARASEPGLSLEREGDREYIAPEVFFEGKYGKPADMFSLGLILLEAACSVEIPDNGTPWHKLRSDDFSDVSLDTLSPALRSLITSLLASQPVARPTASEVVEMPALVAVRNIMRRGLRATELDQLPAFDAPERARSATCALPASKYYVPRGGDGGDPQERTVVRVRGALIQEDEMAFLAEVFRAADARSGPSSPDTSTSIMTEDSLSAPEAGSSVPGAHECTAPLLGACLEHGMDIDKVLPLS